MLNAGRETGDAQKPPMAHRQNHVSGPWLRIGPTARLCADAECWTGDGRRSKTTNGAPPKSCGSGPWPRIGPTARLCTDAECWMGDGRRFTSMALEAGRLRLDAKKKPAQIALCGLYKEWSQPLSRVLSWTVIRLGLQSLTGSSNLPAPNAGRAIRGPIWSCFGWSLPCHGLLPAARCALTAPFHPYLIPLAWAIGGLLSVALVVGSRPPGVTWHPAL